MPPPSDASPARFPALALLALLALALAGCTTSPTGLGDQQQAQPRDLSFITIEGCRAMNAEPVYVVIRDQAALASFWAANCADFGPETKPPTVDFATRSVVAAMWGRKPTSGYAIEVKAITQQAQDATIAVQRGATGQGCFNAQVVTYPSHIVSSERITGEGKFQFTDVVEPCGGR